MVCESSACDRSWLIASRDWRNWTVVAHTTDSITFSLVDPDGMEGFPGQVIAYATYTLTPYHWHLRMTALSTTKKTPIMMSSHVRSSKAAD